MALHKMLVPVALEPRDAKLLAFACGLSCQGIDELLVAHVVDNTGQEAPVMIREVERARERLREMVEPLSSCGMAKEVRVATGAVFPEVMALAHQTSIDVICCGTEGKSFVDYLFSGSVSEDLALKGDERTMTIRYSLLESVDDPGQIARDFARRLVVPTDFSASAMRAVLSAFERPADSLGTVHVVHALTDESKLGEAEAGLQAVAALAEGYDLELVTAIREGNPTEVLLAYVNEVDATGVITGRQGRSRLGRGLLGSVSMSLMHDAPCPVVIQP